MIGQSGQTAITFQPVLAGRTYEVQWKTNLSDQAWTALESFTTSNVGSQRTVTDLAATTRRKFYRVKITRQ